MINPAGIAQLKDFLDGKYLQYNTPEFIIGDPVSVPHLFSDPRDIEISGFLTATISWGRRGMIAKAGQELMRMMDFEPTAFVLDASDQEISTLDRFVYRTFNGFDLQVFVFALRNLLNKYHSLEAAFFDPDDEAADMAFLLNRFRTRFFSVDHPLRTRKHLPDPFSNSAAKRTNMFLRWMIRNDQNGVDFGIWKSLTPSRLICPLDLHSGQVARKLGLLTRRQNDWKAALELTESLRLFDPSDPVKYDFALFGLGWYEKF